MPLKKKTRVKAIKAYAYGILNAYGDFWTGKTFESEQAAHDYLRNWELKYRMLPNHTVVPVLITPIIKGK